MRKSHKLLLSFAVTCLSLAAISGRGAARAASFEFVQRFGEGIGFEEGQFYHPSGIVVNSTGNIFVADSGNSRIQEFGSSAYIGNRSDATGNFLAAFGSPGSADGQFNSPGGIAIDSKGDIFVADTANNRIQEFDSHGNFLAAFGSPGSADGQFNGPKGIAFSSTGDIFVADTFNNRIQEFDSHGNFLAAFGSPGSANGQFEQPSGIAVNSKGDVFVADTYNNRIQEFDSHGNFLTAFGSRGFAINNIDSAKGQFDNPFGVAVNSTDDIFVADTGNSRIQEFDPTGNFLTAFISDPFNYGLNYPEGITIDSKGNVFVADTFNNRAVEFAPVSTQPVPESRTYVGTTVALTISWLMRRKQAKARKA